MKIYFINEHENIHLDYQSFAQQLKIKNQLESSPKIEFVENDRIESLIVNKSDIVCLGFGHYQNSDFADTFLPKQIDFFIKKTAKIILTTELRTFEENEDYFAKSHDNLILHQLAYDYRLKILDLYSFENALYQQKTSEQLADFLIPSTFVGKQIIKPERLAKLMLPYLISWFSRRFFRKQFIDHLAYGGSLYPEVWDEQTNETDMQEIKRIGMNTVRIGEFFWDKLEPEEGHYKMSYLADLLTKLNQKGLKVIVGIPTPTPPRWFTLKYPETKLVNQYGTAEEHGSRQHVCTNNPIYRRKAYQLTYQIAKLIKQFDNVTAVQIDNEFKCHVDQCFCSTCQKLWSKWLKAKYQNIDFLNQAWGTSVWSETYPSFESVVLPVKTPFAHNSSLDNAFRFFTADTLNDFASGIAQILISETNIPVTHNTSLNFNLRNYELFEQLDVVGFDTYPMYSQYWNFPINLDLWRNLKSNNEVLLLETGASHVGWIGNYVTPHPRGYLPTEIFLGFASGLKSFLFWPYRAQPSGVEQTHGAIVTQTGTPDLGYDDVLKGQQAIIKYRPFIEQTQVVKSKIALIYSDDAKREMRVETGGIYEYRKTFTEFYRALTKRGLSIEVIPDNVDFDQFDCVIMPYLRHINQRLLKKMKVFTQNKGQLIIGPLSGDRTAEMTWIRGNNALGELGDWLNITNEVQYLSEETKTRARVKVGTQIDELGGLVTLFDTDQLMKGVETIAPVAGHRSVIYQNGRVIYLGGMPRNIGQSPLWDKLVNQIIKPYDADHIFLDIAEGIVKYRRENDQEIQFYLANMTDKPLPYQLYQKAYDEQGSLVELGEQLLDEFDYQLIRIMKEEK